MQTFKACFQFQLSKAYFTYVVQPNLPCCTALFTSLISRSFDLLCFWERISKTIFLDKYISHNQISIKKTNVGKVLSNDCNRTWPNDRSGWYNSGSFLIG